MCSACVEETVERCLGRVKELQSLIARLHRLLTDQMIDLSDPAAGAVVQDDG
jgi:hypothetical protein